MTIPRKQSSTKDTLILLHVVFRHGERTPIFTFPTDLHGKSRYRPYGFGQLTNKGKQRIYQLGQTLRKYYSLYLDKIYTPEILHLRATNFDRTKMSGLLCVAGLFPPAGANQWNKHLNWQPIPYHYGDNISDFVLTGSPWRDSIEYSKLYKKFLVSDAGRQKEEKYRNFYTDLATSSGLKITDSYEALKVLDTVMIQRACGLEVPEWAIHSINYYMSDVALTFFDNCVGTREMRQLFGGPLLYKILRDSKEKIENRLEPLGRKIFLYSGHDTNIYAILKAMNVTALVPPAYGVCIIVEIHKINNEPFIKVLYKDDCNVVSVIPESDSEELFPFYQFCDKVGHHFPKGKRL